MSGSLRIAHVTTVHVANDNRIFHKYVTSLARRDDLEVHYAHRPGPEDAWPGLVETGAFVEHLLAVDTSSRPRRVLSGNASAWRWASRHPMDVYHVHDPELLGTALLLRLRGRRVVFDVHENIVRMSAERLAGSGPVRAALRACAAAALRLLTRPLPLVFAESSYRRDFRRPRRALEMLNYPMRRSAPLAIAPTAVPCERGGAAFAFVYVGTLTVERGCLLLIDAFARFVREVPGATLDMVGISSTELRALFAARVREHDAPGVTIGEFLDPSEVPALLSRCDVGLSMLAPLPNYVESVPTKIYDYIGAGLITITSDFPFYRETFADLALYADPTDIDSLLEAMRDAYRRRDALSARVAARGGGFLDARSWENQLPGLLEFYDGVVRDRTR